MTKIIFTILIMSWLAPLQAGQHTLSICTDYHCEAIKEVALRDIEWGQILEPFETAAANARQERQKISQTIALFEQVIGLHAGTHVDMAENQGEDGAGQLDCISESRNTAHYLEWLNKKNQLQWHTVKQRISRASFLFDIHWTAVIEDKQTKKQYAVDSWFYKNGETPIIQPMNQWINKRPATNTYIP